MRSVAIVLLAAGTASADPTPAQLKLAHEPAPRHLRMRPRAAAATKKDRARTVTPLAPPVPGPGDAGDASSIRDVRELVSARVNLGYVVDGTTTTNAGTVPGTNDHRQDFATIRAYGLGDVTFSTRGVGLESMATYFAGQFQITRRNEIYDPASNIADGSGNVVRPPPIATWFDRSGFEPRAAWAEMKDFVGDHDFAPLRVRGGELYIYGPWVLHMYGATAAWDGKLVSGSIYGGSRVPDYNLADITPPDRAGIFGGSLRIDLRNLTDSLPITIGAQALHFDASNANAPSGHGQVEVDWRPRRDVALIGDARVDNDTLVNEHLQLRSRYKQVTNVVFDLTHRHANDWLWDPSVTDPDPLAAKRYLDLGPVLPQLVASLRGGTLIKENIDVYVRAAASTDETSDPAQKATYSASYAEAGGALEVRLRRTIAVAATVLSRQTMRVDLVSAEIPDVPKVPDPLLPQSSPALGERGFTEIGVSARMSLGARKFSAMFEIYGRRTRYALDYCDATLQLACQSPNDTGIQSSDIRGGGRVTIDAWIGKQLRLFASYELSSAFDFEPEITGYKSLRLMMEGIY